MLIMLATIAAAKNTTNLIPDEYWPIMASWAHYVNITAKILGNQLSTDDYLGPLRSIQPGSQMVCGLRGVLTAAARTRR